MNENEVKALVVQTVNEVSNHTVELNQCKNEYKKNLAEVNETLTTVTNEKNEAIANSEAIQKALDDCKNELSEAYKKIDDLYAEMDELRDELGKAKAKERIGELSAAIAEFSETERAYAKDEIEAFNEKPIESEINFVVSKIWEGIGKNSKKETNVVSEKNSAKDIEDIFGEIVSAPTANEDTNIF